MIKNRTTLISLLGAIALFSPVAHAATDDSDSALAYYSDSKNDLVYIIDVDNMALQQVIPADPGSKPYPIDRTGDQKTYVSTRNSYSVSVIDNYNLDQPLAKIELSHKPRSTSYNPRRGLALVSGADAAYSSVIKVRKDKVKVVVGQGEQWDPEINTDFGGSNATGHPFWHGKNRFFQLNRPARQLEFYRRNGRLLDTLSLPTTAHHLFRAPASVYGRKARRTYFMALEGNPSQGIPPGVARFMIRHNRILVTGVTWLECSSCDPSTMGGHHADLSPDGSHIYMGSKEGHLFIIDSLSMNIVAVLDSGAGSGHTRFIPGRNLAIVTNHYDNYVTLINTENLSVVDNITVTGICGNSGDKSLGHTTGVSPDERFFYGVASCNGEFFRIDLDSHAVDRLDLTQAVLEQGFDLPTGTAYPIQGAAYFWE